MKKLFTVLAFLLFTVTVKAQSLYFPPTTGNTWDTVSPASLGWCQDKIDTLIDYLQARDTKAFILLKDGKIAIEHYFDTFTADSVWYWASAGKSLTGFTIGIAQQNGSLNINDLTSQYLGTGWTSELPGKENLIKIRNQITMTTGLDDGVPDNTCTTVSCLQYKADAGTRWAYHNAPYTLLDSVIRVATGQTLNTYVAQKIGVPTGMTGLYINSGYDHVFYSKPRSMARFGLLILNKGNWNGNQVMTDTAYFHNMVNSSQTLNPSYGYLWWLNGKASYMMPSLQISFPGPLNPAAPTDMFAALGKNGQLINVVPSMNLVFIRMGNTPRGNGAVSPTFNDTIWQKLNKVFCGNSPAAISNAPQAQYVHIYPNPVLSSLNIDLLNQPCDILICDVTGRKYCQQAQASGKTTIDATNLPPGVYFLQIKTNKETYQQKFLRQ
jgi:CubicO group peptidase (beta-lactamase class C family)